MALKIFPLEATHLPQVGDLLARRHSHHRRDLPGLPPQFEDPDVAQQAVAASLNKPLASGYVALEGDWMQGFLVGEMVLEPVWGRSGWVRYAGCGLAEGADPGLVAGLYAALGDQWVAHGIFSHFAQVPATDQTLIQAWFHLSFGLEQIHALRSLEDIDLEGNWASAGVEIRQAGPQDREVLADFSDVIWRHQVQAPVWGITLPEYEAEIRASWAELADEAQVVVWLAYHHGQPVGIQGYWPAEEAVDDLMIPARCVHMSVAGTRPQARRQGVGRALTHHGLQQAQASGYQYCETDWRSTNLPADRLWRRVGFRPAFYRLVRRIDARIAWANGSATLP